MIGDWIAQTPALLVAVIVVFAPGLLIGAGLRLRGLALFALAPVVSTAFVAALAIVYGAIGIPWTLIAVTVGIAVGVGVAWLGGHFLGSRRPSAPHTATYRWILVSGLAIGIAFCALRFVVYVSHPAALSQTNDAVFHDNAIRYILEIGSASSLHVSGVAGGSGFYPAAWHALTSLVALAGAEIPVAANMVSLVIMAGIWPLGIAWLTQQTVRGALGPTALAAALAAGLHTFPMLMFQWGVLYPYALSVALLPAAAAVLVAAPGWLRGKGPVTGTARSMVLLTVLVATAVCALTLAQPATLLAWAILAISGFTWWAGARIGAASGAARTRLIAGLAAAWFAFAALWLALSLGTTGSHWPPFRGRLEALLDVVVNSHVRLPAALGVSILMVVGLVIAVRRPALRWLATAWLAFAVLYAASAAIGNPEIRGMLLGAWYADPYRIAALAPVTVIPLAAIGLAAIAAWAAKATSGRTGERAEMFGTAWALVAVTGVGAVWFAVAPIIDMPEVTEGTFVDESLYTTEEFLSADERALLERLGESVPDGARIIGNPSTGSGYGYMLSGRDVFPRTWANPRRDSWTLIGESLRDAAADPDVCAALEVWGNPEYVLDFGPGEESPGRYVLPGMTGFAGQPGFELVDEQGDASLWRITACGP